jgi:hypothetical protein
MKLFIGVMAIGLVLFTGIGFATVQYYESTHCARSFAGEVVCR